MSAHHRDTFRGDGPPGWSAKLVGLIGACVAVAYPMQTWAAGGGGGRSTEVVLLIISVVAVAYLVAHLALERIADRFGVVTGIEYIVIGAVIFQAILPNIAPAALGAPSGAETPSSGYVLDRLRPVIVLGTGSLGLLIGLQVRISRWSKLKWAALREAIVISAGTVLAVVGVPLLFISLIAPLDALWNALPLLLCAGAVSMAAADAPIRSLASFLGASGPNAGLAVRTARMCSSIAIILFGLIFCFYHAGGFLPFEGLHWLQWLLIHLLVGSLLGGLFGGFLQQDYSDDKILAVAIGMVVFASGVAYGLQLSPIFVNFIMGVVLAATGRHANHARHMLLRVKHPLYIVLFIFAGARLDISVPYVVYALAIPYLVLRVGGRLIGGIFSSARTNIHPQIPGMGRILLFPGALSIAIALDFLMIYTERGGAVPEGAETIRGVDLFGYSAGPHELYAMLILGILLSEIIAYATGRTWLIDAADVSPIGGSSDEDIDAEDGEFD